MGSTDCDSFPSHRTRTVVASTGTPYHIGPPQIITVAPCSQCGAPPTSNGRCDYCGTLKYYQAPYFMPTAYSTGDF